MTFLLWDDSDNHHAKVPWKEKEDFLKCWKQWKEAVLYCVVLPVALLLGGTLLSSRPAGTAGLDRPPLQLFPVPWGWGAAGCRQHQPHSPWNQRALQFQTTPFLHRSPWSSLKEKDKCQTDWKSPSITSMKAITVSWWINTSLFQQGGLSATSTKCQTPAQTLQENTNLIYSTNDVH